MSVTDEAGLYPSVTPADLLAEGDPEAPRPAGPQRRGSLKGGAIPPRPEPAEGQ